jgi:hypothetical protein
MKLPVISLDELDPAARHKTSPVANNPRANSSYPTKQPSTSAADLLLPLFYLKFFLKIGAMAIFVIVAIVLLGWLMIQFILATLPISLVALALLGGMIFLIVKSC